MELQNLVQHSHIDGPFRSRVLQGSGLQRLIHRRNCLFGKFEVL